MRTLRLLIACLLIVLIPLQALAASLERVWHPAHIHVSAHQPRSHFLPEFKHQHADRHHHEHVAHSHGRHVGGHAHPMVDRSVVYVADADLAALKSEAIKRFLDVILQPDLFAVLTVQRSAPIPTSHWVGYCQAVAPPERPPRVSGKA